MRWPAAVAGVFLLLARSSEAAAQPAAPASTHTRTSAGQRAELTLRNVRLVVPAGVVDGGAVVGLGVGGAPAVGLARRAGDTELVVSAAGGLRGAAIVVVLLSPIDLRVMDGAYPALLDTVTGAVTPCLVRAGVAGCRVSRVSAFVLVAGTTPAAADPGIDAEIERVLTPAEPAGWRPWPAIAAVIVAVVVGFGVMWWFGGRGDANASPP